jgi:uncharacterized membrane protein
MTHLLELLDLAFRWVHVIAAIMWIGNSLLFNWLDRNLRPSSRGGPEVYGDIWLLHSGGFYFVEKTSLSGQPMPRPLHWFKWQAYTISTSVTTDITPAAVSDLGATYCQSTS